VGDGEVEIEMSDAQAEAEVGPQVYAMPEEAAQELIAHCLQVLHRSLEELKVWDPAANAGSTLKMPEEIQVLLEGVQRREVEEGDGEKWRAYLEMYNRASPTVVPAVAMDEGRSAAVRSC
jgi:hypothetical protein